MNRVIVIIIGLMVGLSCHAQDYMRVVTHNYEYSGVWTFPYGVDQISYMNFNPSKYYLKLHRYDENPYASNYVPLKAKVIDSIYFPDPVEYGKDKYQVFTIAIHVDSMQSIPYNDYIKREVNCYVSVDGKGQYPDYSGSATIRGRGNSTWRWYPKKPYKIKLDQKSKILGMGKAKNWVLLANYRDPTDMLNAYAFIVAKKLGIPYTTPVRFAEVFINNNYQGVYQIAEQVEQGSNRVDVADDGGILMTLDVDDGPNSPVPIDKDSCYFSSSVYNLPINVKYPKNSDQHYRDSLKVEFAKFETILKSADYDKVDSVMDIDSYIGLVMLNAFLDNDDFTAPRSTFISKDVNGKWTWGPAWDFDAGYAFNWSPMTTSKTFFEGYESNGIVGNHPANHSTYYTAMFKSGRFTQQFIDKWNNIKDSLLTSCWDEVEKYVAGLEVYNEKFNPQLLDLKRWPLNDDSGDKVPADEIVKMKEWLKKRIEFMNEKFNNLPILDN